MLLLSAAAFARDSRSRDALLSALRSPQFNFREDPRTGAWTWVLRQGKVEAAEAIGHNCGPLTELAKVLGVPTTRLRAALPEEWIAGDFGADQRYHPACRVALREQRRGDFPI